MQPPLRHPEPTAHKTRCRRVLGPEPASAGRAKVDLDEPVARRRAGRCRPDPAEVRSGEEDRDEDALAAALDRDTGISAAPEPDHEPGDATARPRRPRPLVAGPARRTTQRPDLRDPAAD